MTKGGNVGSVLDLQWSNKGGYILKTITYTRDFHTGYNQHTYYQPKSLPLPSTVSEIVANQG